MKSCSALHIKLHRILILVLLIGFSALQGCKKPDDSPAPAGSTDYQVRMRLNVKANGQPISLNRTWFANAKGDSVLVRAFSFFVSNIKLTDTATGTQWTEADSYHLVTLSADSSTIIIKLKGLPKTGKFNKLTYAIGVDQPANSSSAFLGKGDLVLGNGMDWNWADGWKFLSLEGNFKAVSNNTRGNFVYHIGFNSNYRIVNQSLASVGDLVPAASKRQVILADVNLEALFVGPVDVTINNNEMGNNAFTNQVANNYASAQFMRLISLQTVSF